MYLYLGQTILTLFAQSHPKPTYFGCKATENVAYLETSILLFYKGPIFKVTPFGEGKSPKKISSNINVT